MRAVQARRAVACADVDLWVSKSGRQGVGLTIAIQPRQIPCTLRLDRLALEVSGRGEQAAASFPVRIDLLDDQMAHRYVALPFDDSGPSEYPVPTGVVHLDVTASDGPHALWFDVRRAQGQPPRWGMYLQSPIIITETDADGVQMVFHINGPARIGAVELLAGGQLVASRWLGLAVDASPQEIAEVPLFLPLTPAQWDAARGRELKLRVSIIRPGGEARWTEDPVFTRREDAP